MNKKFLSAILFGALMITSTGTFVSCKDYDDDIDNLQEQINNLATKADVEAKLAQLQTALAAAQADAAKALAEAKAADDSAEIAALQAKIDAFKSCTCDVEAMMAEIKDATDAQMAEYKAEIEALIEKTEDLVGEIASLVTDVELILTDGVAGSATLPFITATQVKNEGWGPNKELTFTKDAQTNFGGSIVARVSPTNAVPTASSISFINSKGDDLSALIEVGTPKKFEGVLARAAETGLWEIPYNVKSYAPAALKAAKYVDANNTAKGQLLYALAVNNLSSNEEGIRNVVSGYDLTIADDRYVGTDTLYFTAGGERVVNLKNRYGDNNQVEYKWAASQTGESLKAADRVAIKNDKSNVTEDTGDNRTSKNYLSVKVGVPFNVALTNANGKALPATKKSYRFYVTLDKAYAEAGSEPSEINVWENYAKNTTGLNVLDTDGKVTITINDATAEGDVIGYRVYAVNYDGTVVDPDGKAFYVYVGNPTAAAANLTLAVKYESPYDWTKVHSTAKADFSTSNWGRATTHTLTVTDPSANNAVVTGIVDSNFVFYKSDGSTVALPSKDIVKVAMVNVNPAILKDGVTYVATFTAKNDNGVVATATVSFTKQLPAFPSSFVYPFTNVLQNSVLHIYPVKSATTGMAEYNMTNVWHGLTTTEWSKSETVDFVQVVTDAQKTLQGKTPSEYPTITYDEATDFVMISDDVLDPNNSVATQKLSNYYLTEFPVNVAYSYDKISYAWDNTEWDHVVKEWKPVGNEIKMVFRNYAADLNIAWEGEVPTLNYPGVAQATDSIALSKIKVTDWYGSKVDLSVDNDYFLTENVDIVLLTGDNEVVNEYYEAEIKPAATYGSGDNKKEVPAQIIFTSKVNKSQGTAVPTTIKVVITDKFGYEVSKSGLAPFSMSFTK